MVGAEQVVVVVVVVVVRYRVPCAMCSTQFSPIKTSQYVQLYCPCGV